MIPLKKSIEHLATRIGTKKNFFVNDFDKKCMQSVITWYNKSEQGIKFNFQDYYKLVFILIRNEIELNRLQHQLGKQEILSINQVFTNIENKLLSSYGKEQCKMILDCYNQKLRNYDIRGAEINKTSLETLKMNDSQEQKILDMVESFTLNTLLK